MASPTPRSPDATIRLTHSTAHGRALLTALYDAAVAGAAPGSLTASALQEFQARPDQRLWLYAFGKAAHPMAAAAAATFQRSLHRIAGGVIVSPETAPSPYATIVSLQGDHPLPGRHSFTAAQRLGDVTTGMRSDDVAVVLISGGTTSLIAAPLRGMAESDLGQLFELLLASGLDIKQMNCVRKRFSRWGAGRLALALAPARTFAYVMSDVPGDDPADIASGPCAPDDYTVKDVIALLQQTAILPRLSAAMREYLTNVGRGVVPETPGPTHPAFAHVKTRVIGSNRLALDAARVHATERGLDVECDGIPMQGDAAAFGTRIADSLIKRAEQGFTGCVVWGGETTVNLAGRTSVLAGAAEGPPIGGRCQELALSAARRLSHGGDGARRISILAAGTDGRDGTTDAAGAFADADLWTTMRQNGQDPELALQRHEAHSVLAAAGALLPRRNTGTNVMDVVLGVIE